MKQIIKKTTLENLMAKKTIFTLLILFISSILLVSCNNFDLNPTPTITSIPSATSTEISLTSTSVPTPLPSLTISCNRDKVLENLKANFPYSEFEINYSSIQGTNILALWFVDPAINPDTDIESDIERYAKLAIRDSIELSIIINYQNQCIEQLFTIINPIVVDSNYNGWFSGNILPENLPRTSNPTESQLNAATENIQIGYVRQQYPLPSQPVSKKTCSWAETRTNIQRHFDPSRQNVSFMYVRDESGVHIDAQWDSDLGRFDEQTWWGIQIASMFNIITELECLHPIPSVLNIIVVDLDGKIILVGTLPEPNKPVQEIDLDNFKIIYQNIE